jgi:hypothetical protein
MQNRSFFVLVFNLLDDDYGRIAYWLQQIRQLKQCRCLLVGTHLDAKSCTPEYLAAVSKRLDHLVQGQRFVYGVRVVSTATGAGLDELRADLMAAVQEHPLLASEISSSWLRLSRLCQQRCKAGTEYLAWTDFSALIQEAEVKPAMVENCVAFLSDAGVITHFQAPSTTASLDSSFVILDNQFFAKLFATVVSVKSTWPDGRVSVQTLENLWRGRYPPAMHGKLIKLLEAFEIGILTSKDEMLVPAFLPLSSQHLDHLFPPISQAALNSVDSARTFTLAFLPMGFFSKVVVRFLALNTFPILDHWQTGLLTGTAQCLALVRQLPSGKEIEVRLRQFTDTGIGAFVSAVLGQLESLLARQTVTQRSVACSHCLSDRTGAVSAPTQFSYETVLTALNSGVFLECSNPALQPAKVKPSFAAPELALTAQANLVLIDERRLSLGEVLGRGAFGCVYKATLDYAPVAVKELVTSGDDVAQHLDFVREVQVMCNLDHPCLVRLLGVTNAPFRMVLEFIEHGDLYSWTKRAAESPEILAQFSLDFRLLVAFDVAKGMQYLHSISPPIVHRDLRYVPSD